MSKKQGLFLLGLFLLVIILELILWGVFHGWFNSEWAQINAMFIGTFSLVALIGLGVGLGVDWKKYK